MPPTATLRNPHSALRTPQSAFRNPHSAAPLTPTYGREPLRNVCKAAIRGKSDVAATVRLLHASARQNGVRKQREHGRFWLSRPPPRSQAALNAECEMRNAKCGMRKSNWDARGHCAMCARPPPAARRMLPPRYEFWTRRQGRATSGSGANTGDSGSQGHRAPNGNTPHSALRIPQSAFRNPHSAAPLTPTYGREPLRNVCKAAIRGKSDVAATVRLLHASARQNGVRKQREHGRFWLSRPPPRSQAALNAECEMRNAKCGMRKSNWDARGHCAMCARPPPAARRMLPPRYEFWTRRQGRATSGSGANTGDSGSQGHRAPNGNTPQSAFRTPHSAIRIQLRP